jgi:gamma-glutamyltranspeptidase / glutathione hydrolase
MAAASGWPRSTSDVSSPARVVARAPIDIPCVNHRAAFAASASVTNAAEHELAVALATAPAYDLSFLLASVRRTAPVGFVRSVVRAYEVILSSARFTTRPEIDGTFGVVATTHWIASAVAMGILERGGNAFDAGVAAAFTLQIVEPHLNGPGGDVSVILHDAKRHETEVICGQGPAPAGATIAHYRSLGLDLVPGTGLLAACIPGAFDTWMLMLRDHGTMRVRDVLEAAIGYAKSGYPLVEGIPATIRTVQQLFRDHWPSSAAVYLPGGEVPRPGALFTNVKLADTYERVLRECDGGTRDEEIERARRVWSQGFVAEAIDEFCRTQDVYDVSGKHHRGVLTGEDIATWKATVEQPIHCDYGRFRVFKPTTWSQGLVCLQQLALLQGFDLEKLDPTGADFIHVVVEAAKLAFADREAFYGDPVFVDVPIERLLSDAYNAERRRWISERASLELPPGSIAGAGGEVEARETTDKRIAVSASGTGEPTAVEAVEIETADSGDTRGDTVHFDIIDRWGNMVSSTPSGGWLQSSPTIPELGFCLGSRAQMFWLDERHPAALQPGKRPRSTLSPTLAYRDGAPYMAWGSPGGDQQDQWIPQMFLRHVHSNMNLQEAIDAPAWHTEHFPSSFWPRESRPGVIVVESRLRQATVDELARRGHRVEVGGPWSEGRLTGVRKEGVRLKAAANPRGMQGYAVGR